jgi:hypothetical protein
MKFKLVGVAAELITGVSRQQVSTQVRYLVFDISFFFFFFLSFFFF